MKKKRGGDTHGTQESDEVLPLAAFVPTLPKAAELALAEGIGENCLFIYARFIKAFEATNGITLKPDELRNAFSLWWNTARPLLPADADFDEYRFDFEASFAKVRAPWGANPLAEAIRRADLNPGVPHADPAKKLNQTISKYYPNGLTKSTESTRTGHDAGGASVMFTIKTEYEYDAQGRVTKTKQYPSNNPFTANVDESAALHITTQTYNALGKVAVSTDKYGRNTRYYYDNRGNLAQTVYPDNTITRTVYDVNNRPIYQQAAHLPAAGDTLPFDDATTTFGTHTVYDAFGRSVKTEKLTAIKISLLQVNNDVNGQPVPDMYKAVFDASVTGTVLESTTTGYDAIGRVLAATNATLDYRRFTYSDANGNALAKKETFVGAPSQTEIKIAEEEYDPNGNIVFSRTFDAGNLASLSSFEYDELNRQTKQKVHNLDGSVYSESKTTYDAIGRRIQIIDADSKSTDFAYDGAGHLRFVTNWLVQPLAATPIVTEYTYDEVGNLIVQKDALGRETKYEYDNFGRRIRRTLPGSQSETLAYDVSTLSQLLENSQLVQRDYRTDFNGQTIRRNYDVRGRLTWKGSGDGANLLASFTYTPWGARSAMTDLSGTTTYIYGRVGSYSGDPVPNTFSYDSDRLFIRQRVNSGTPASTDAFLYEHDASGNMNRVGAKYTFTISGSSVTAVSSPNTSRTDIRYEYDWRNRLNKVRQGSDNAELASYTYSDPGVLKQTTYTGPVIHHTYTYNTANQLLAAVIDKSGTQLRKFDYNPAGHEPAKSGQRRAAWEYGAVGVLRRQVNYVQDSLNRLAMEDIVADNTGSTAIGKVDYVYDNVGNRLSRQTPSTALALKIPNFALPGGSSYDANDRLPAPEVYDNNGNTLKGDLDGVAGVEQTVNDIYDLEDRLTTSTRTGKTVTLAYDGDGNRTRKDVNVSGNVTTTRYVVDDRTPTGYAQVLEEWESVNGSAWTLTRKYTYGLSRIRQERLTGAPGTDYYGYDGHGSVALLTDPAGTVGNTYSYDAYGVLLAQGGNTLNNYLYAAEQWDSDLGMYYLRARYLNPQSGRFWTMDTFEGNSSTPLSLHKYLYAHANPVNGIDPTGHEFSIFGVSVSMSMSHSFSAIYNGVVSAFGAAARMTIFGAQAGKGMNEILTEFILDETGLSTAVDLYQSIGAYFKDDELTAAFEYQAMLETVIGAWIASIPEDSTEEYELEIEPQCFLAGTQVLTKDGAVPIELIKVGDEVFAYSELAQSPVPRKVVNTFVRTRDSVLLVKVGTDLLGVTAEHPFFVHAKGWVRAGDLLSGDQLVALSGELVPIESVARLEGTNTVYNFEVAENHNYFVGDKELLTHNASAAQLRKAMGIRSKYVDAHHIIAQGSGHKGMATLRKLLEGFDLLNDKANGVALPRTLKVRSKMSPTWRKVTAHHGMGVHSPATMDAVVEDFNSFMKGQDVTADNIRGVLVRIGDKIKLGSYDSIHKR